MLEIVYQFDPEKEGDADRPSSAEVRARLTEGNALFASLSSDPGRDQRQVIPFDIATVSGIYGGEPPEHQPFAGILSCSDARVPIELVFHQSLNDLLVV